MQNQSSSPVTGVPQGSGLPIAKRSTPTGGNVFDLMGALKASLKSGGKAEPEAKPIKAVKKAAAKPKRKAG